MLSKRRFRPAFLPSLAALAVIALTLSLGNWQTRRAEEKAALGRSLDEGARAAMLALPSAPVEANAFEFHRVGVRGEYLPKYTVLLDNKVLNGAVGYHVLTPLRIAGGELHVLVDRGWVAAGARRDVLPAIETPAGVQSIEGVAMVPTRRILELGANTEEGMVWENLVLERYAKWSGLKLQPVVIEQTNAAADGLARVWVRPDTGVDKHRGYAFQWYALASLTLVAYVAFSFKRSA